MILYRHADPRFPFLWESPDQPAARWHDAGEGPAHYLADTADGAWAEFLRHEGITKEGELENVRRALWAVEVPGQIRGSQPELSEEIVCGGLDTYEACRAEARRLRQRGIRELKAPSAALIRGGARGWTVDGGLQPAAPRDGNVIVFFGARPDLTGWAATSAGRPRADLLGRVRHFGRS
ncbi:MAG: RES domain-containing protein [Bryobacterales bacterium]|nr:RES domain-containing protein [Bryobacterales bacterium]